MLFTDYYLGGEYADHFDATGRGAGHYCPENTFRNIYVPELDVPLGDLECFLGGVMDFEPNVGIVARYAESLDNWMKLSSFHQNA